MALKGPNILHRAKMQKKRNIFKEKCKRSGTFIKCFIKLYTYACVINAIRTHALYENKEKTELFICEVKKFPIFCMALIP